MNQSERQIMKVVDGRGLYLGGYVVIGGERPAVSFPPNLARLFPPPEPPKVLTAEDIAVRDNIPRRPRARFSGDVMCPRCAGRIYTTTNESQIVTCRGCDQRVLAFGHSDLARSKT
jgi:ribosomal protein S27E